MEIKINQDQKEFKANLHFVILDKADAIVAASFVGLSTACNAIESALICGLDGHITTNKRLIPFRSRFGQYKRMTYQNGSGVTHGMVFDKYAVYQNNKDQIKQGNSTISPVIIAPDGCAKEIAGKFLAHIYSLPLEWDAVYPSLIEDHLEELQVITNPDYPKWSEMNAIKLSGVDQEFIESRVQEALKSGRLKIPPAEVEGKFDPNWTAQEYTQANAPILAKQISKIKALHDPDTDDISPEIAGLRRIPFPAQAHCIQGLANALDKRFDAFANGDMGSGKTQLALGVAHLLYKNKGLKRILISAPGLVVPKWADEIKKILPGYAKVRIIRSTEDALKIVRDFQRNKKPKHVEIVIVSTDRAKLGPEPWFSGKWMRVKNAKYKAWHCPDCYKPLPDLDSYNKLADALKTNENAMPDVFADWEELVDLPKLPPDESDYEEKETLIKPKPTGNNTPQGYIKRFKRKTRLNKCPYCESKLWRPANKYRGETRISHKWFICKILKNAGKIFDLYIGDEIHQTKAGDSGRGFAFSQLVKCTKKFLALTGTLTTGKSTSIKHTLWRVDPKTLIKEGFTRDTGDTSWAQRYGVLQETVDKDDVEETDEGVITIRKGKKSRVKEMPGISPELTATYLLDRSIFLELGELGLPLPEIKEIPVFCTLDQDHKDEYQPLHENLYAACSRAAQAGNSGAFSKFISTVLNYLDRPDLGAEVEVGDEVFSATKFDENYYHAKERKLVELVNQELEENRNVVIYTKYSKQYQINERILKVLNDHGIDSAVIMPASISTDKRIEWVEEQSKNGTRIIICNLELLSVGVDLIDYPTIIKYQLDFRVNEDRQNGRRHWRVGQQRECRTFYLVYDESYQMNQFKRLMAGRGQAMFVEGRLDRSELSEFAMDENTSMAYSITQCLAESDLAEKWARLAEKDIDENIETVSEEKFKERTEQAMKQLTRKTLWLCGVDPKTWRPDEIEEEPAIDVFAKTYTEEPEETAAVEPETAATPEPVIDTGDYTDIIIIDDSYESDVVFVELEEDSGSVDLLVNTEPYTPENAEVTILFPEFSQPEEKPKKKSSKNRKQNKKNKKKKEDYEQLSLLQFM